MSSLAIIRATDILKLKSTLSEMRQAGIEFEDKPKEINPSSLEKTLSGISDKKYEFCTLVQVSQDRSLSQRIIKNLHFYSDVLILDSTHEIFKNLVRLIPVLPDLEIPDMSYKDTARKSESSRGSSTYVYLGIFVDRKVQVETSSGKVHSGILKNADSIGVFFEPSDNSASIFFTWHDIRKIIIPREEKK